MAAPDGVPSTAGTPVQDVYTRMKAEGAEEDEEEEEFVTASECTRSPSRSSSYHTASDGGGGGSGTGLNLAHWWQDDEVDDSIGQVLVDSEATRSSEVETSDKQVDEDVIPLPPPPPPLPPSLGKIGLLARRGSTKGREITETTLTEIKVSQSHTMGIMSYVVTSETIKDSSPSGENISVLGHDNNVLKDDSELVSEPPFVASPSEQISTESMQNETTNGTLSEEELMQQMEEGSNRFGVGGGCGGVDDDGGASVGSPVASGSTDAEASSSSASSGSNPEEEESEEGGCCGTRDASLTAPPRMTADWKRLCQGAAATRLQQEHGRT